MALVGIFSISMMVMPSNSYSQGEKTYCDVPNPSNPCHDRKDVSETTGLATCIDGSHERDWRDCKGGGVEDLPECDGSYQDCVTEDGFYCEAGSGEHECEVEVEEEESNDNDNDRDNDGSSDDDGAREDDDNEGGGSNEDNLFGN